MFIEGSLNHALVHEENTIKCRKFQFVNFHMSDGWDMLNYRDTDIDMRVMVIG